VEFDLGVRRQTGLLQQTVVAMASFAENNLAMAYLPVTICKWIYKACVSSFIFFVQTFCRCLLAQPEVVRKVRVRQVSSKSFQVTWKGTKTSIINPSSYEVQIKQVTDGSSSQNWKTVSTPTISKAVVSSLEPDTEYDVRVKAKNARGESEYSGDVRTRTFRVPSLGMGSTGPLLSGGTYAWEQTLKEVTLRFELPKDMTTKNLHVDYKTDSLALTNRKTGEPILEGKLRNTISPSSCVWSRDPDTGEILVELEKKFPLMEAPYHWSCVFQGHPQVDCRLNADGDDSGIPTDYLEEALLNSGKTKLD